jgi:predicted amidohydrolase
MSQHDETHDPDVRIRTRTLSISFDNGRKWTGDVAIVYADLIGSRESYTYELQSSMVLDDNGEMIYGDAKYELETLIAAEVSRLA